MPQAYRNDSVSNRTHPTPDPAVARTRFRDRIPVQENMGLTDRMARFVAGGLLTVPVIYAASQLNGITWEFYTSVAACYLLLTAMLGWDPIYSMMGRKTCDVSANNRCGSLPYEMKVARGEPNVEDEAYKTKGMHPAARVEKTDAPGNTL